MIYDYDNADYGNEGIQKVLESRQTRIPKGSEGKRRGSSIPPPPARSFTRKLVFSVE